ncbi:MAG: sigma-70 family RNA polymerase sigma factor [Bacteroidota bacterium]
MTTISTFSLQGSTLEGADGLAMLISQCIANDKRAQKQLYERFAPSLYAKIRRYVSEVSEANEILNDSFFKIFTNLTAYSSTGSFEGWMHRITINTIMDFLRKQKRYNKMINDETEVDEMQTLIPETSIGKLAYKELLALVHSLPDAQRSVFNLFVFDNCTHKEIGELLSITENNSRWHLNDARRRLKQKLDALK